MSQAHLLLGRLDSSAILTPCAQLSVARSTGLRKALTTTCEGAFGVRASGPPFGRSVLMSSLQVTPTPRLREWDRSDSPRQ